MTDKSLSDILREERESYNKSYEQDLYVDSKSRKTYFSKKYFLLFFVLLVLGFYFFSSFLDSKSFLDFHDEFQSNIGSYDYLVKNSLGSSSNVRGYSLFLSSFDNFDLRGGDSVVLSNMFGNSNKIESYNFISYSSNPYDYTKGRNVKVNYFRNNFDGINYVEFHINNFLKQKGVLFYDQTIFLDDVFVGNYDLAFTKKYFNWYLDADNSRNIVLSDSGKFFFETNFEIIGISSDDFDLSSDLSFRAYDFESDHLICNSDFVSRRVNSIGGEVEFFSVSCDLKRYGDLALISFEILRNREILVNGYALLKEA